MKFESQYLEFKIEYELDKESGMITATIPALSGVTSYGETFAEVEKNIKEAALGYIEMTSEVEVLPKSHLFTDNGTYIRLVIPKYAQHV